MEEIVRHVIANIPEDTTAVCQHSGMPVEEDYSVRKFPERECEDDKQGWWHHKSIFIHGKVVMDSVQKEVQGDTNSVVRKESAKMLDIKQSMERTLASIRVNVEQESMHYIFDQAPKKEPKNPVTCTSGHTRHTRKSNEGTEGDTWKPHNRNHIPRGLAQRLQKVPKEGCRFTAPVVTGTMDLLQIEFLAEPAGPQLHKQRLVEVQKLVLLVIFGIIRFDRQVFFVRNARGRIHNSRVCISIHFYASGSIRIVLLRCRISAEETNKTVIQDFVGRLGVFVRGNIAHNLPHVFASIFENQIASTRMIVDERRYIVHLGSQSDIARFGVVMGLDLSRGEGWQDSSRHSR